MTNSARPDRPAVDPRHLLVSAAFNLDRALGA
jgi:hypothetical protein